MNNELDELNGRVTTAILEAEIALDKAITAWEKVERAEKDIAKHKEAGELERNIAWRGTGSASVRVAVLRTLRGREPWERER